jgi:HPt (histidine-containing phosphotransfer) domain-containing protein
LSENVLLVVWERHRPEILERVALIERAVTALIEGNLDAELLGEAQSAAHTLAGTVGTFGYTRASQLAREIESELHGAELTNVPRISKLTSSLRGELEAEAAATLSTPPSRSASRL